MEEKTKSRKNKKASSKKASGGVASGVAPSQERNTPRKSLNPKASKPIPQENSVMTNRSSWRSSSQKPPATPATPPHLALEPQELFRETAHCAPVARTSAQGAGTSAASKANAKTVPHSPSCKLCKLCGRKFTFRDNKKFYCCYGKTRHQSVSTPSAALVQYCVVNRDKWMICTAHVLSPAYRAKLRSTSLSHAVEQEMLHMLQAVSQETLRDLQLHGHSTRPWSVRASDLNRPGSLFDCFGASAEFYGSQRGISSAAIGELLHALLDSNCNSHGSLIGGSWAEAKSGSVSLDSSHLNIFARGCCDAVYENIPVELKTIDDMHQLDSSKLRSWLLQVAVYQCMYSNSVAVLVILCRKTFEIKAYEVQVSNIEDAIHQWRRFVAQQPLLGDCISLARPYWKQLEYQSSVPLGPRSNPRVFLDLLSNAIPIFLQHVEILLAIFSNQLDNITVMPSCVYFVWTRKYLKSARAMIKATNITSYLQSVSDLERRLEEVTKGVETAAALLLERGRRSEEIGLVDDLKNAFLCYCIALELYYVLATSQANFNSLIESTKKSKSNLKTLLRSLAEEVIEPESDIMLDLIESSVDEDAGVADEGGVEIVIDEASR